MKELTWLIQVSVEQWFPATVLRAACSPQAAFVCATFSNVSTKILIICVIRLCSPINQNVSIDLC